MFFSSKVQLLTLKFQEYKKQQRPTAIFEMDTYGTKASKSSCQLNRVLIIIIAVATIGGQWTVDSGQWTVDSLEQNRNCELNQECLISPVGSCHPEYLIEPLPWVKWRNIWYSLLKFMSPINIYFDMLCISYIKTGVVFN